MRRGESNRNTGMPAITMLAYLCLFIPFAGHASSSALLEQGPANSDESQALRSNLDVGPGTFEFLQQIADDFVLQDTSVVGGISWEGFYFQASIPPSKAAAMFSIRIYEALGAPPIYDATTAATFEQVGSGNFGSPIYRFSVDFGSGGKLNGAAQYWI